MPLWRCRTEATRHFQEKEKFPTRRGDLVSTRIMTQRAAFLRQNGRIYDVLDSDHDLPSCWLRRLAAVVSGKRLACAEPLRPMVILSVIEAIFEIPTC